MDLTRREAIRCGLMAAGGASLGLAGCGSRCSPPQRSSTVEAVDTAAEEDGAMEPGPSYRALESSGELARREEELWEVLRSCRLCPRRCGADRLGGEMGVCSSGAGFKVASFGPHFGEEPPLVGRRGSGTIFFSSCNLLCVYCQNWEINHRGDGDATSHEELAEMMLGVQSRGCHNVNLVTPTHLVPHIVKALRIATGRGLWLPLVYNTSGYDSLEVLRLLDGVVDVYLPDFKYQDDEIAARFSADAPGYVGAAAAAIAEMHRQVGVLRTEDGVATRGLLIRHLVLPENLAGSDRFVRWVAAELGPETHVNLMDQYRPMHRAGEHPPLDRRITREEFSRVLEWARQAGLRNLSA